MSGLVLCACKLAKHTLTVDGPTVAMVVLECEHCDRPCTVKRCPLCTALSHAGVKR